METTNNYTTLRNEETERLRRLLNIRTYFLQAAKRATDTYGNIAAEEWQQALDQVQKIVVGSERSDRT